MNFDVELETLRALVTALIVLYLWRAGRREQLHQHKGWRLILAGFSLILFASLLDITDNFPSLNQYLVIGKTPTEAFLEKLVGYLGGFIVLFIGLTQWFPIISRLRSAEIELRNKAAELESMVLSRTANLLQKTEELEQELKLRTEAEQHAQAIGIALHENQQHLQESKNHLRAIFDTEPECVKVVDRNGQLLDMNAAGLAMLEADSVGEAQQHTIINFILPEYRAPFVALHERVMSGESGILEFEVTGLRGTRRWLETHAAPMRDATGKVAMLLGIARDITGRKRTEMALRESEARFRNLVETTSDWIWEVDENIVFTYVSPKIHDILGYEAAEIIGKTPFDLMLPDEAKRVADIAGTIAATRKPFINLENTSLHKNGHPVVIETSGVPVIDTEGKFHGYRGINRDITERKEYEEELKRSNTELEQFSYAVSHDMRQPLRMISSYLQLIEMSLADQLDGKKRGYFNIATEGAKRIDQMLGALLEYSRVGRMGDPPTWIESRAVLDEALQFIQPAIAEAQARLNITGDWPRILVRHDEIQRLIQNLIGNAAKYRIAGRIPEITVSSGMVRNEWHLCVADNGVGIIPDQINRLFKMFQRLQTRTAYEGTGIGLALCRKIAEHHKGRIWAESAGEGRGSKFCIVLPVPQESNYSGR